MGEYESAIDKLRSELAWEIINVVDDEDITNGLKPNWPSCRSIPEEKAHYIYIPKEDTEFEDSLLHELCHATLSEKVHPFFGGPLVAVNENCPLVTEVVVQISSAVADWYVENMIANLCPNEVKKYFRKYIICPDKVIQLLDWDEKLPPGRVLTDAYRLLLAFKYLDYEKQVKLPERWEKVIKVFNNAPEKPSLKALRKITNEFLALFFPPYQVKVIKVNGIDEFGTYKSSKLFFVEAICKGFDVSLRYY